LTMRSDREHQLPTLPGEPPDPRDLPIGCPFAPRCAHHQPACDEAPPPLVPTRTHDAMAACIRLDELQGDVMGASPEWPPQSTTLADYGNPSGPALVLSGVTKAFSLRGAKRGQRQLQALRGIDLEVVRGGSVALVGESGCGKSTLLRVVAGLLKAD